MKEYSYKEIEEATEGFSVNRLIGKGSHGTVYKGKLKDGKVVAVKKPSFQGESKLENEISILGSINNPSLVNLLGFSHTPLKTKLLIMEFMPKGSLYELIHLSHTPPSWFHRALLSLQIARAILSLHEALPCRLIHRDIKSTNILLDSKHNARLSDFGLAVRKNGDDELDDQSVIPAGTIGYIDPCYTESGQLGPENDVYSFGVLLLEIISSRKVFDLDSDPSCIGSFAIPMIDGDNLYEICDKRISLYSDLERFLIARILHVARRCISEKIEKRPLMKEVVEEFQGVVEKISWPFLLPIGVRVSSCVYKCVRIWKRCVRKRVMTTKIVCKQHLMVGNGGGIDDCGNDVDLKLG